MFEFLHVHRLFAVSFVELRTEIQQFATIDQRSSDLQDMREDLRLVDGFEQIEQTNERTK